MVQDSLQLQFNGRGSAFNVLEGNTSAFIKFDKSLLLFDCGSSVFERLIKESILEGIEEIVVVVTHTHDDHVGSLGALIAYAKWVMKAEINVVHPNTSIINFLEHVLVPADWYNYVHIDETGDNILEMGADWGVIALQAVETQHVKEGKSFGYIVDTSEGTFYYSGDAKEIPDDVLNLFRTNEIETIYHDSCILDYEGNVHMAVRKLCEIFEPHEREYIHLMHIDNHFDIDGAEELGFNVVEVYKK